MSGFDLVPVDGGDPVHLPPGETVLGRGALLGITDKRVSRLHGLLENLDGQLRLKPTHVNPCFVQSSLTDEPQPLQRDTWYPLHHGDLFSLLPGRFIYKVVAVGEEDRTPRNSQMFEEEKEELPVSPKPDVEQPLPPPSPPPSPPPVGQTPPHEEPTPAAPSDQEEADDTSSNKGDSAQPKEEDADDQRDVTPPVTKKRVLPAWMMAAAAAAQSPSSSPSLKVQTAAKRSRGAAASTSTKGAAAKKATTTKTSSSEGAEVSEEEMPKKRRRKISDDEEEEEAAQSKTDVPSQRPSVQRQRESKRPEVSDESDGFTVDQEGAGGETSTADLNTTKNGGQQTKQAQSVSSSASKPQLRTPCPYGKDCYRTRSISRSAVTPVTLTMRRRRSRRRLRRQTDLSAPTAPTATGKTLFTGKNTNTQRNQLALHEPPPKRRLLMMKTKTRTLGTTTASLMMTARIWAMTQTTSLLAQTTAVRRTSKDYRRKRRPL
ncbi:aprataxin and PNK-like factor isoform X2 [Epinephelus fuscoguttatus]|uniref:aprataxin and PNK-like factor isoform X2 n=1 Tax=Epinephelus fuscoguttatus TaxID=293821 RepID=UPI0020D07C9D|nr:aprataxin and PNK-like factor isoform X2 [Epinephelus fuscoguttatus]